ncbi:Saccharopine dehydrogenase [Coemansia furcata]|uniref:Saccharopine dehydrogenase n=1 Tax=Coemansia furcata TaxID=417177 RepID=A0ACC1L039_9FUNG|nr:Saccharopine dehydrogenase [Coemansia furcata]
MWRSAPVPRGTASREANLSGKRFQRWVIHYDDTLKRWQTFWIMSMVNSQTALWAGRTLNYGPGFSYSESMSARSLIHAIGIAVGLLYGLVLMMFGFTRNILYAFKIVPRPGEGPSEEFTRRGFFSLHLEAFTPSGVVYGKVAGTSDPGYGETITYMGESALCLAFDRDETFKPGVYPPSVIMGTALLRRLRNKGCQFDIGRAPIPAVGIESDQGSKKEQ